MSIVGLGPHGERAAGPERLAISDVDADLVRKRGANVAIVLHTTQSDWAKQQLAGIARELGRHGAAVIEVVDCRFDPDIQNTALERLAAPSSKSVALDAIISIPVGGARVADAHRGISRSGTKLILLDNVPSGLLPGKDYASMVSADNFGLGKTAAELLSPHLPQGSTLGLITYAADFFVTNERALAFRTWMERYRPDAVVKSVRFAHIEEAGDAVNRLLSEDPETKGLFVVWDEPAAWVIKAVRERGLDIPMTTVDLGLTAAMELATGGLVKGVAAQQPYDQGVAAADAALLAIAGRQPPPWVALPGLAVTQQSVVQDYQIVWHAPAPPELIRLKPKPAHRTAGGDAGRNPHVKTFGT